MTSNNPTAMTSSSATSTPAFPDLSMMQSRVSAWMTQWANRPFNKHRHIGRESCPDLSALASATNMTELSCAKTQALRSINVAEERDGSEVVTKTFFVGAVDPTDSDPETTDLEKGTVRRETKFKKADLYKQQRDFVAETAEQLGKTLN